MSQPTAVKNKPATAAYTSPPQQPPQTQTTKANEIIKPESSNAQSASLSQLFSQAEPIDILYMVLGSIGSMVTGVSLPIFNILFGQMLDSLNKKGVGGYQDAVNQVCISFVIVAAANVVAGAMQVYFWSAAGERQTQRFREKYVRSILSQEIGWFDTCGASELSTKVADLTGKVQDGLGRKAADLIQYFTQLLSSYAVGFYLSWKLTVVLIASFPIIAGAGAFMINAVTAAQNESSGQYAAAGGLATETLGAVRTVTALNAQPAVINQYRRFLFDAMRVGIHKGFKVGLGNGLLFGACFLTYALGFWYGGTLVADSVTRQCQPSLNDYNCISGGSVMAVFFSIVMGSMALGQMAPPLAAFGAAKAAVLPILEIIQRKPLIDGFSEEGEKPTAKTAGHINLDNVTFAYPSRPDILVCRGYQLKIEAGQTVAFCGASGAGKSTVINLLLRFYDPQGGGITLDGKDIRSLNVRWLRSQIGYVGQEPVLFSGSILDNIAYGIDKNVDGEVDPATIRIRVEAAARQANAHDFIMGFPQGYDTDVGSNGVAMSGGQKQRIAIARALVKRPAVLLLDEATSALDAASERVVQQSIDALSRSKAQTTIVIAHRLSTIRSADKIAVVSEGVIAELGSHHELIAKNGLYADLVRLQMTGDDEEESAGEQGQEVDQGQLMLAEATVGGTAGRSRVGSTAKSLPYEGADATTKTLTTTPGATGKDPKAKVVEDPLAKAEGKAAWGRIWGMIMNHPMWFFSGLFGAAVFGAIFPCWGLMLAKTQAMFYYTDPNKIRDNANLLACFYILLGGLAILSATLQFWGTAQVGERISMKLRSAQFENILRREIGFFDDEKNAIGDLTTRLSDDSRIVHKAAGESVARQIQAAFTLLLGLALGLNASWKVALVVLAVFPVNIAASAIQMAAITGQQYDQEGKEGGGHGAVISSAFNHMRTVSAFSMQWTVSSLYAGMTSKISNERIKRSLWAGLGFGGAQCSLFCTYALLFWYGSTLVAANDITFEQMMTAILTLMLGALGLGTALADMGDQTEGLKAAARIFRIIDEGQRSPIDGLSITGIKGGSAGPPPPSGQMPRALGRIELKNVNFRYPSRPDVEVCQDYNLIIEPGECVALVGPSGSGKSTIMNLLLRFYDPLSGQVFLDGVDVTKLNVRWLRAQIGYVGQEPVLFQGSVADNIAKGRPGAEDTAVMSVEDSMLQADQEHKAAKKGCCGGTATSSGRRESNNAGPGLPAPKPSQRPLMYNAASGGDIEVGISGSELQRSDAGFLNVPEDVVYAAKQSNAHDFITEFTDGYNTDVGEGSIMVSGGQKQRIAIARALVKRPAVLLLDEATSALDAGSERVVQQSIDALQASKTQTTIVIAHRLTTIMNADRIAVIDKGRVVEIGKHEELLAKDGLYAQLWYKQKGTVRGHSANNLLALAEAAAKENVSGGREDKEQGMLSTLTMGMLG